MLDQATKTKTLDRIKTATEAVLARADHRQMPKAGSPVIVCVHDANGGAGLAIDGFTVDTLPAEELDATGIIACADVWRQEYAPETVGAPLWILTLANMASSAGKPESRVIEEIGGDNRRLPVDRDIQVRQRLLALNGGMAPEELMTPAMG